MFELSPFRLLYKGCKSCLGKPSKTSEVGKRESEFHLGRAQEVLSQDLLNSMNESMAGEEAETTQHT